MATNLVKVSGVLSITQTAGQAKYYAATAVAGAKWNPNGAADGINLTIQGDSYYIALTDLTVNGQIPATMSTALVLLNSIFGS